MCPPSPDQTNLTLTSSVTEDGKIAFAILPGSLYNAGAKATEYVDEFKSLLQELCWRFWGTLET